MNKKRWRGIQPCASFSVSCLRYSAGAVVFTLTDIFAAGGQNALLSQFLF
jgi:hypothetical protein